MTEDTDLREAMRTVRGTWRVWALFIATIVLGGFGAAQLYTQRDNTLRELAQADARATQKQAELAVSLESRTALDQRVKKLEEENRVFSAIKAAQDRAAIANESRAIVLKAVVAALQDKMKTEMAAKSLSLEVHGSTLTIVLADRLLFDTPDGTISRGGIDVLTRLGAILASADDHRLSISGFFDQADRGRPPFGGGWELAAVRAAAVAHFLHDKTPVAGKVAAIEVEPNRPLPTAPPGEARARSHRLEIAIAPPL
jgi:flagellar motor protein MotB